MSRQCLYAIVWGLAPRLQNSRRTQFADARCSSGRDHHTSHFSPRPEPPDWAWFHLPVIVQRGIRAMFVAAGRHPEPVRLNRERMAYPQPGRTPTNG
jgi:hypothetical protein